MASSFPTNPFIYEDAINPDVGDLVGRSKKITELIEDIRRHGTVVLTGTRFIGKTSILNFLTPVAFSPYSPAVQNRR
jgi:putative ribosome biogenesis GTPase RsgA